MAKHFTTWAMPMQYIDGNGNNLIGNKNKQQELFNQSYYVQITPLVIYSLGDGYSHIYTLCTYKYIISQIVQSSACEYIHPNGYIYFCGHW